MDLTLGAVGALHLVILIGMVASAAFYLLELYSAREFFGRPLASGGDYRPAVTVLKPLKGLDAALYDNLASFCRQRYPAPLQLVFGVADPDDPAVGVVRRLQRDFPALDIELVVDGRIYGANYKVSNLHNLHTRAKHEVIVIADSDIRVGPDYLARIVAPLADRQVGLVTCIYRAMGANGLPAIVEALFVNTDFAALVMLARKLERLSYAFGASIAMRREVLDEIGGFLPLANSLADDYQLGHRVAQRGYRLELSAEIVDTLLAASTGRRLFDHQLRWARTYRVNRPIGYFLSIVTHGTFWALLNSLAHGFGAASLAASAALLTLRHLVAARLAWTYLHADLARRHLLLVAPKDLFLTALWVLAFLGNEVVWGDRRFAVRRSGEMIDVSGPADTRI